MNNLKISTRIAILIGIMSVLLMLIGGIGLYGMVKSDDSLKDMYEGPMTQLSEINEIRYLMLRNRLVIANADIEQTPERTGLSVTEVEANMGKIEKIWASYMASPMPPEEAQLAKSFSDKLAAYENEGLRPALASLRKYDYKETVRIVVEKIRPTFDAARDQSDLILKLNLDEAKQDFEADSARFHTIRTISIASIVLGLVFSILFGLSIMRGITGPLQRAVDVTEAVAQGD
jgi:methyl-accepting chemotaxis protein-1 (serine sensor receptor)